MSESESVVRRFLDEVISNGKAEVLDEVMDTDLAWHGGSFGELRGLDQFKQLIEQFFVAFPDLHADVDDVLVSGDKVVVRLTASGTQTGELMGIPASGKHVTWTDILIYRVAGGKIVEEWFSGDYLGLMQQIGAMPRIGGN
jgi:predicted ester cyclase